MDGEKRRRILGGVELKQHITVEQLKEFTLDIKERIEQIYKITNRQSSEDFYNSLPDWCKRDIPTYQHWFDNHLFNKLGQFYYEESVKLNIGKMIETLGESYTFKRMDQEQIIRGSNDYGFKWHIELFHDEDCPIIYAEDVELCDALWNALKVILHKS